MRKSCCLFWVTLFSIILSAGCGTTRFARWNQISDNRLSSDNETEPQKLEQQGDSLFQTQDTQSIEAALMKWELASRLRPSPALFLKLSRGHFLYGEKLNLPEHFNLGLGFAERGLIMTAPDLVGKVKAGFSFDQALVDVPNEALPILRWYAANLEKWAKTQGLLTQRRYFDDVKAINLSVESNARLSDSKEQK